MSSLDELTCARISPEPAEAHDDSSEADERRAEAYAEP